MAKSIQSTIFNNVKPSEVSNTKKRILKPKTVFDKDTGVKKEVSEYVYGESDTGIIVGLKRPANFDTESPHSNFPSTLTLKGLRKLSDRRSEPLLLDESRDYELASAGVKEDTDRVWSRYTPIETGMSLA